MSATLFGEVAETQPRKSKPITSHQLIQHYRAKLVDRLEEATSVDGPLFGLFDCDSYGALLATLFPEEYGQANWKRSVQLTAEEFQAYDASQSSQT